MLHLQMEDGSERKIKADKFFARGLQQTVCIIHELPRGDTYHRVTLSLVM
jgi:hypothetical protein